MNQEQELNTEKELTNRPRLSSNEYFPLERSTETTMNPQLFASSSHKPGFIEACILILLISGLNGILQGYPESLEVIIMAKGASYSDQAVLSLNKYPFMFKIFFVPFLDMYYVKKLGKSKTLILISGFALFLLLFFFGVNSEHYIKSNSIWVIASLWFFITIFGVLILLGADTWSLTLFQGDRKHMGGILLATGVSTGMAIGYNLFVLLNSQDWWNEHILKSSSWKLQREIVTHKGFIRGVSFVILFTTIYCLFFVKEKVVETSRTKTLGHNFKTTKRMLQVTPIFKMLVIFFFDQVFVFFFNKSIELKFIEYGVDKAHLVNIHSSVLPIKLALMALAPFYAKKSYLIRQVLGFQIGTIMGALLLLAIAWSMSSGSEPNSTWMMLGFMLREMVFISRQLMFSKVTEVIPEDIGATAYTIFAVVNNCAEDIPPSIGLKVVDLVAERTFFKIVLVSISIQFIAVCSLRPLAVHVDHARVDDFNFGMEQDEEGSLAAESGTRLVQ